MHIQNEIDVSKDLIKDNENLLNFNLIINNNNFVCDSVVSNYLMDSFWNHARKDIGSKYWEMVPSKRNKWHIWTSSFIGVYLWIFIQKKISRCHCCHN